MLEKSAVGASQWIFRFRSRDGHLKIWFGHTKNMINNYDVIKKHLNEDIQKAFARSHSQTVQKMFIPFIILTSWWTKAEFICIHIHRTLSEGQEIDIRSFFFVSSDLRSYDWNSFFLVSYHSTWSYWVVIRFFVVYHVDKSRDTVKNIFTSLTVRIWNRKIWDKLFKLYPG